MAFKLTLQVQLLLLLLLLLPRENSASEASCSNFKNCRYPRIIILDAGSTGTRVHVFKFDKDRRNVTVQSEMKSEKRPGLDSFANFPQRIHHYLQPLINFSKTAVPADSHSGTPIFLAATAGLRALTLDQMRAVIRATAASLRRTPFSVQGKISDNFLAMVLTGKEEASLAWFAANVLLGGFHGIFPQETYSMLELGGGSTQIAVTLPETPDKNSGLGEQLCKNPSLRFPLYLISYLGLGKSAASLKMFGYNGTRLPLYRSPCLHPDFSTTFSFGLVSISVAGDPTTSNSSRWTACQKLAAAVLKNVDVDPAPILTNHFVAIGAFYYVAKGLQELGYLTEKIPGNVTLASLSEAARRACQKPPSAGKFKGYLCLDSAYIVTLLKAGYKFTDGQRFSLVDTMNGISVGWPLGLAAMFVKEPCCAGNPAVDC